MADKSFGVKELNLISASGTPTITSPNSVNINATNVAISTDITVGGMVSLGAGTSISSPGTNVLTFGTNSTEKVRITSGGSVGIGTDTPGAILEVFDATSNTIINVKSGDSGAVLNLIDDSARSSIEQNGTTLKISSDTGAEDASSDIRLQVDGSTKMLIDDGGDIGVGGITSPSFTTGGGIHLKRNYGIGFGDGSNGRPDFQLVTTAGSTLDFRCGFGADTADIQMTTGGNLVFANGGGIDFSATADGSGTVVSELFDDYEEGTFTPTVEWSGTSATLSGGTYGRYTKIGNTVIINFRIIQTARNATSGSIRMYGLPFAEGSSAAFNHGMVQMDSGGNMPSGAGSIMMYIANTTIRFLYQQNTGHNDLDASHCVDGTAWYGFATYFTS